MDKTTRAAREILDDEAETRLVKTARLRKARLEREASSPQDDRSADAAKKAPAKPRAKPAAKS
ncbi:hypothetical protein [Antarcticimicrobium luteum]|nr:hypothetical protein [Antarcticimicrobium luteum]